MDCPLEDCPLTDCPMMDCPPLTDCPLPDYPEAPWGRLYAAGILASLRERVAQLEKAVGRLVEERNRKLDELANNPKKALVKLDNNN
uniref:Uncharacterized protein n=1 Tax=Globodera rostochiensis TaxID=31243 RepID=A0A914GRP4_GLORO